jgi:hypothetical protein
MFVVSIGRLKAEENLFCTWPYLVLKYEAEQF